MSPSLVNESALQLDSGPPTYPLFFWPSAATNRSPLLLHLHMLPFQIKPRRTFVLFFFFLERLQRTELRWTLTGSTNRLPARAKPSGDRTPSWSTGSTRNAPNLPPSLSLSLTVDWRLFWELAEIRGRVKKG